MMVVSLKIYSYFLGYVFLWISLSFAGASNNVLFINAAKPRTKFDKDFASIQTVLTRRLANYQISNEASSSKQSSVASAHLKEKVQQSLARIISVCYERFQRCAKQISPQFCASSTKQYSFYLWAKKLAQNIMKGTNGIQCPEKLLELFQNKKLMFDKY